MKCLVKEELDSLSHDYICFKRVVEKFDSKELRKVFLTYQKSCIKKLEYLVFMKTYKYKSFPNYFDLRQEAFEALLLAFNTYDPNKGSFTWWANQYIKTRVSRAANAHSTIRFPLHKTKEMTPYKTNKMPIMVDKRPDPLQLAESSEDSQNIQEAIKSLPEKHQAVVNMTFGCNNVRQQSINNILGILDLTRSQYIKILKESKYKIKEHILHLER